MDEKILRKKCQTDEIARRAFCVGGLFYPIKMKNMNKQKYYNYLFYKK